MYADLGNTRAFYEALRSVYGPSHQIQALLRSSDDSDVLTDRESILRRWTEHYRSLFGEASIANIPQQDVKLDLDDPLTQDEVRSVISKLKCHDPRASMVVQQRYTS